MTQAPWILTAASQEAWIWPAIDRQENQFVEFRHVFTLTESSADELRDALLELSVDTNYVAWLNGRCIGQGQYRDYPDRKIFDALEVGQHLRPGLNVLGVLAYHQLRNSSVYCPGDPGLIYRLRAGASPKPVIFSGTQTLWRQCPTYVSGTLPVISSQLSFTFIYDARRQDNWRDDRYEPDAAWQAITPAEQSKPEHRRTIQPRPVQRLVTHPPVATRLVQRGRFAQPEHDPSLSAAQLMQEAILIPDGEQSPHAIAGRYELHDMGREEAGLLDLEITAPAGTIIDIGYGEHLDDGRVRTAIGTRNFASRYICRQGRQQFTHAITRWAGRYLQVHVYGDADPVQIHHVSLRPQYYPAKHRAAFETASPRLNQIHETSVRTLELCRHEHYEDCPWREQALYSNDMRNQAIVGYYCFGDYDFTAASLELLRQSLREDGYLSLTAPTATKLTIPTFTFSWILAAAEHLLYSGDYGVARRNYETIAHILNRRISELQDHLLPQPSGKDYWNFYDWAPGLSGTGEDANPHANKDEGLQPRSAITNLYLCLSLDRAGWLAEELGDAAQAQAWRDEAAHMRKAIHPAFWNEQAQAYQLNELDRENSSPNAALPALAELTQSLALLAGVPDVSLAQSLRRRLAKGEPAWVPATLSQMFHKFEALLMERETYLPAVMQLIEKDWGYMLDRGTTSWWETLRGGDDFSGAASLCHGWSAVPPYFYYRYLLGIEPVAPGYKTCHVRPLTHLLSEVNATAATPQGLIRLRWQQGGEVHIVLPEGIHLQA